MEIELNEISISDYDREHSCRFCFQRIDQVTRFNISGCHCREPLCAECLLSQISQWRKLNKAIQCNVCCFAYRYEVGCLADESKHKNPSGVHPRLFRIDEANQSCFVQNTQLAQSQTTTEWKWIGDPSRDGVPQLIARSLAPKLILMILWCAFAPNGVHWSSSFSLWLGVSIPMLLIYSHIVYSIVDKIRDWKLFSRQMSREIEFAQKQSEEEIVVLHCNDQIFTKEQQKGNREEEEPAEVIRRRRYLQNSQRFLYFNLRCTLWITISIQIFYVCMAVLGAEIYALDSQTQLQYVLIYYIPLLIITALGVIATIYIQFQMKQDNRPILILKRKNNNNNNTGFQICLFNTLLRFLRQEQRSVLPFEVEVSRDFHFYEFSAAARNTVHVFSVSQNQN